MNKSKTGKTAMKSSGGIGALLIALCCASAQAADKPPSPGTIGTGTFSCGKFAKYDASPNNSGQLGLVVQWTWGFMSAYNARAAFAAEFQEEDAPNPVSPPDAATVLDFIRKHCEKNPLSNVANATLDLITTMGGTVTSTISFPSSQS